MGKGGGAALLLAAEEDPLDITLDPPMTSKEAAALLLAVVVAAIRPTWPQLSVAFENPRLSFTTQKQPRPTHIDAERRVGLPLERCDHTADVGRQAAKVERFLKIRPVQSVQLYSEYDGSVLYGDFADYDASITFWYTHYPCTQSLTPTP